MKSLVVLAVLFASALGAPQLGRRADPKVARTNVAPLAACQVRGGYLTVCDPGNSSCCAEGFVCKGKSCARLCTLATSEAFCDEATPCSRALGYVCTENRCRPPSYAIRVESGQTCNQGGANTLFCTPKRAMCVNSVCQPCVPK